MKIGRTLPAKGEGSGRWPLQGKSERQGRSAGKQGDDPYNAIANELQR